MSSNTVLFNLGQQYFRDIVAELAQAGITVSPTLALRESPHLVTYYNFDEQVIYLALPNFQTTSARLQLLQWRALFGFESTAQVFRFFRLILHWQISHEIAHHLRHRHGLLSGNLWHEEQIAHSLGITLSKPRFSEAEREECQLYLQQAVQILAKKIDSQYNAVDAYQSLPHSLYTAGLIDRIALEQLQQLRQQTQLISETLLRKHWVACPSDIEERLQRRYRIIRQYSSQHPRSIAQDLYYYLSWLNIALMSLEHSTIQEFATRYLNADEVALS